MRKQERLFSAIGGVDEVLLERSERLRQRGQGRRWLAWAAAAAACLAVMASVWIWAYGPGQPAAVDGPIPAEDPVGSTDAPPRLEGEGQLHLLRYGMEQEAPPFSIYFDELSYHIYEPDGLYIIRPNDQLQGMPACQLEIAHMPNTSLDEAVEAIRQQAEILYRS